MEDFEEISELGEGAYSKVYKVKRKTDKQIYALKKVKLTNLSDKEKLNAVNEVRILASIKNPFVISYKEAFFIEEESVLGIVMEFCDGGDLYQKIRQNKKKATFMEELEIWKIFIQIVKGLKSLHDLKILHRDLKSANVFLCKDGSAKLGDLNVSKVARRGLGYTQTGTPYYASPEVWKDQPYDNKSDVWSLGCVLYEMIALRPPFRAENMEGLYKRVIKGGVSKLPERFSADLQQIVKWLLTVSPDLRPSCDQILKHHSVQKRIEFFQDYTLKEDDESALLQTIRVPRNLLFLSDKLPQPNYEPVEPNAKSYGDKGGNDLPSIVVKKKPNPEHSIDKILEKREKARLNAAKPSVRKGRSQDVPPSRRVVKRDDKKTERSYEKNRVDRSYEKRRIERSYEKKRVERSYEPVLHGMKKYLPRGLKVMPSSHRVYEPGYYSPYLKNKKIYQKYRNEAKINLRSIKNAMEIRPVKSRERKEQKRIIANRRLSPIKKKNRL